MMVDQPAVPMANAPDAQEMLLWQDLRETGSPDARVALFNRYLPLTRKIARQHHLDGTGIEYQDLVQYGCAGLLEAIDRFDVERNIPFAAYARRRVTGSILDGVASATEVQQQLSHIRRRERDRVRSLLPEAERPTSTADAYQMFAELAAGLALGYILEEESAVKDGAGAGNAYESTAWKQTVEIALQAVADLSEREQLVIRGHYEGGLTFDRIGELLGVSKGRVSQLHRAALTTLRKRIGRTNAFIFQR